MRGHAFCYQRVNFRIQPHTYITLVSSIILAHVIRIRHIKSLGVRRLSSTYVCTMRHLCLPCLESCHGPNAMRCDAMLEIRSWQCFLSFSPKYSPSHKDHAPMHSLLPYSPFPAIHKQSQSSSPFTPPCISPCAFSAPHSINSTGGRAVCSSILLSFSICGSPSSLTSSTMTAGRPGLPPCASGW